MIECCETDTNFKQLNKLTRRPRHRRLLLPILEQFVTGIYLATDLSFAAYVSNQENAKSMSVIRAPTLKKAPTLTLKEHNRMTFRVSPLDISSKKALS
jgi:hypothetical protein